MVLWESDGKYSQFDEIFGNKPVQRREKDRQNIRICRIHQLHLISGKGFWFYGNHRTNQDLPLQMVNSKLKQTSNTARQITTLTKDEQPQQSRPNRHIPSAAETGSVDKFAKQFRSRHGTFSDAKGENIVMKCGQFYEATPDLIIRNGDDIYLQPQRRTLHQGQKMERYNGYRSRKD